MRRKKAQYVVHTAHGVDEPEPLEAVTSETDPDIIATLKRDDTRRAIPRQNHCTGKYTRDRCCIIRKLGWLDTSVESRR